LEIELESITQIFAGRNYNLVDLKKLRQAKAQTIITDPIEIFRRLPKPEGINDLYTSQAEVLGSWAKRRDRRESVIKLHTGGGKTLVGLLIAKAIMNATKQPVAYICSNAQLVEQTLTKAAEYSIPAVSYIKKGDLPSSFLAAESVLICVYHALFNGHSKFGTRGEQTQELGAVIVDDAHAAFDTIRDAFSLEVKRADTGELYDEIAGLFRKAFKEQGKVGTYDAVVGDADFTIMEVPYWTWHDRVEEVRAILKGFYLQQWPIQWPFVRDVLEYCHCLITKASVLITPILPPVDLIPSFSECKRRIFMSATIANDSEIVLAFDADSDEVKDAFTSRSLAGVSERLILAPELTALTPERAAEAPRGLAKVAAGKTSTVILVPSGEIAKKWQDVATYPDTPAKVSSAVSDLQQLKSKGPFVFANRYDGIDLPGDACRILIMEGLPHGASTYDTFRANAFAGSPALSSSLAQRIEQGIGRGARGPGDYCVVILTGKKLFGWLGRTANLEFLTRTTRAQLDMGIEITKEIQDSKELLETVKRCLRREKEWVRYHAESLAALTEEKDVDVQSLSMAGAERKAFQLWRDGYHDSAIQKLAKIYDKENVDPLTRGWYLQLAARIAYSWGNAERSQELQQQAYAKNRNLLRPRVLPQLEAVKLPGAQAASILNQLKPYRFRKALLADFEETVSHLVPESSSDQFESALEQLGIYIGFAAQRPEKKEGNVGPDVLWLLPNKHAWIIEAKSRKLGKSIFTKENHGQLLVSDQWFIQAYPDVAGKRVSILPTNKATRNSVPQNSLAFTLPNLEKLVTSARALLTELCDFPGARDAQLQLAEKLLKKFALRAEDLEHNFLLKFIISS
jgi:replicative superfamily II helicase